MLFNEMLEFLGTYYSIEKIDLIKLMKEIASAEVYDSRVDEPLHFGQITRSEAKALSQGLNDSYVEPLLHELIEIKKAGYTEPQTLPALYETKEKLVDANKDAVSIFREQLEKISRTKKLTIDVPLELYQKITEERLKSNITLSDLVVPLLKTRFA